MRHTVIISTGKLVRLLRFSRLAQQVRQPAQRIFDSFALFSIDPGYYEIAQLFAAFFLAVHWVGCRGHSLGSAFDSYSPSLFAAFFLAVHWVGCRGHSIGSAFDSRYSASSL